MESIPEPYAPPPSAEDLEPYHAPHHLSPWPLWLAVAATVFAVGVVTHPLILVVGAAAVLAGLIGWIREDTLEFPKGPNPLTWHTIGTKDNGWWGIWLFLATEVVLFGALFATYFAARADGANWGQALTSSGWHDVHLPVGLTAFNTAILVTSGFVMHWGEMGLKKGSRRQFQSGFFGAIVLGAIFLYFQVSEYLTLISEGVTLSAGMYASIFYMLTGTHGFHVFGGLVFLIIIFLRGARGQFDAKRHSAVTAAALYWHFVDVVWILLFAVVYLHWA